MLLCKLFKFHITYLIIIKLSTRLIGCDTLRRVFLDVVVIIRVVIVMAVIRSEEGSNNLSFLSRYRDDFGVCYGHAASKIDLCVRTYIANLRLAGFLVTTTTTHDEWV